MITNREQQTYKTFAIGLIDSLCVKNVDILTIFAYNLVNIRAYRKSGIRKCIWGKV